MAREKLWGIFKAQNKLYIYDEVRIMYKKHWWEKYDREMIYIEVREQMFTVRGGN